MSLLKSQHNYLWAQTEVENIKERWKRNSFEEIRIRIENPDFPCVFAKRAFRKKLTKFIFIDEINHYGIDKITKGILEFNQITEDWDGNLDNAYPLLIVFSQKIAKFYSLDEYHQTGWRLLQLLNESDKSEWPSEVSLNTDNPAWSMCFGGRQLFVNMSTPMNIKRKSRNLGSYLVFVINPRERFDIIAGNNEKGRKVRNNIRNRILHYDGYPHSKQLGNYGSNSLEWQQYGLIEHNIDRFDTCPFHVTQKIRSRT